MNTGHSDILVHVSNPPNAGLRQTLLARLAAEPGVTQVRSAGNRDGSCSFITTEARSARSDPALRDGAGLRRKSRRHVSAGATASPPPPTTD